MCKIYNATIASLLVFLFILDYKMNVLIVSLCDKSIKIYNIAYYLYVTNPDFFRVVSNNRPIG